MLQDGLTKAMGDFNNHNVQNYYLPQVLLHMDANKLTIHENIRGQTIVYHLQHGLEIINTVRLDVPEKYTISEHDIAKEIQLNRSTHHSFIKCASSTTKQHTFF